MRRRSLPDGEDDGPLRLARRHFLSPPIVREAYGAFCRYRAVEEQQRQRQGRRRMVMVAARSPRSSTMTRSFRPSVTAEEVHKLQLAPFAFGDEKREEQETHNTSNVCGGTIVNAATVGVLSGLVSGTSTCALEGHNQPEEEETLGVEGLRQFLNDMGMGMSSLEVSDLVHSLNDDPIDFVLRQRAMEAAAAAEALEKSLRSGHDQSSKTHSTAKTASTRRKGGDDTVSSDKLLPSHAVADDSSRGGALHQISAKNARNDGVTFSQFLFILSHVLMDQERTKDMREIEVSDVFELVDVDRDGLISPEDVRMVVKKMIEEEDLADDRDIQRLYEMNKDELKAAVMECDVDNDGRVTLEDLRGVLLP